MMFKKYLILLLTFFIANLWFGIVVFAQTNDEKDKRQIEKVRRNVSQFGIGKDVKVSVSLKNGSVVSGYLSESKDSSFFITDLATGKSTEIQYGEVKRISGNKPLSRGSRTSVKIGIVAAGIFVLALIFGRSE